MSPWNKPGGNGGDKNPWGQGGRDQGPPDLDEIARKLQQKLSGLFGGGGKGGNGSDDGGMQKAGGIGIGGFSSHGQCSVLLLATPWIVWSHSHGPGTNGK